MGISEKQIFVRIVYPLMFRVYINYGLIAHVFEVQTAKAVKYSPDDAAIKVIYT